ncbi:MAG: PEP-CTERM sorting domain-containing protein [Phycisphaeraceae bacterium]|nr:PEP-CTERM sorting domain-containing protein [Phycisphaeraceae bacterium]
MRHIHVIVALCGLLVPSIAQADDLFPPSWRGQDGTTWAEWTFSTSDPTPDPDQGYNPYGVTDLVVYPGVGQVWWATLEGRDGVWPLSGEIWATIPNRPQPLPWKDIWIQLTWKPQAPGTSPIVLTTAPDTVYGTLEQTTDLDGPWVHSVFSIRLEPNPNIETILITGGIDVDQLVIDTRCVPEPASIGMLVLGGLGLLRRRRA